MKILAEFHSQMRGLKNFDEQENALISAIQKFGYDTYFFGVAPEFKQSKFYPTITIGNHSEIWEKEYIRGNYVKDDMVIDHCLTNDDPLLWSSMYDGSLDATMSAAQRRVNTKARKAGYSVGVTIPLYTNWNPFRFGISFCKEGETVHEAHDTKFKDNSAEIMGIATTFFTHVNLRSRLMKKYKISEKNADVFSLLARGISRSDITKMLGIELSTVKYHIQSVTEKLNAHKADRALAMFCLLSLPDFTKKPIAPDHKLGTLNEK